MFEVANGMIDLGANSMPTYTVTKTSRYGIASIFLERILRGI
jgi:hypothetical protein